MTWYPSEMQGREPSWLLRIFRKTSALVRWVILIALTGFAIAAIAAVVITTVITAIQS